MSGKKLRYSAVKSLLLLCVSSFFGLVVVEVVLSVVRPAPIFEKISITNVGAKYTLSSNPKLIYIPKSGVGENNSYGHRGKEFDFERNPKKRILFMGDSVVEGLGVGVNDRFTEILGERFGGDVEIINLAVRGYNFLQEVEYFKVSGAKFSPDVVFWGITYNDFRLHSGEIRAIDQIMKSVKNSAFFNHYYSLKNDVEKTLFRFNVYRYFKYYLSSFSKKTFSKSVRYLIEDNELGKLIKEVRNLSATMGFRLYFVFLPVNTDLGSDRLASMEGMLRSSRMEILNLERAMTNSLRPEDKSNLFINRDPCHLTVEGHRVVADRLEKYMRENVLSVL